MDASNKPVDADAQGRPVAARPSPLGRGSRTLDRMAPAQLLALGMLAVAATGCDTCENEPVSTALAPDGQLQAIVLSRGCGATVGFNTQLSILPPGRSPTDAGNAVIVDGQSALKVRWLSAKTLEVVR